jgi:hypothetical protein
MIIESEEILSSRNKRRNEEMENIAEKWERENPNMDLMTKEGREKYLQDNCPLNLSKSEKEGEINYLLVHLYILKYPKIEDLWEEGRIEELEEEYA